MKHSQSLLRTLIILSSAGLTLSMNADYKLDFSKNKFGDDVTVGRYDKLTPVSDHYNNGYTTNGWAIERFNGMGSVALSPTHTGVESPCDNRITLPTLTIEEGEYMRWTYRSVHPDFLESFRIEALVSGETEPKVIFENSAVKAVVHTEILSLEEFVGKDVTFSFICDSQNKYMLALGNIYIEKPTSTNFDIENLTPRFQACKEDIGDGKIILSMLNTGKANAYTALKCVDAAYNEKTVNLEGDWKTGERREIEFDITLNCNAKYDYTIYGVTSEGKRDQLLKSNIYASYFVRNLVVDKGTGMWCTNCPAGMIELEKLQNQFGDNIIALETHIIQGKEPLSNQAYWTQIGFQAAPYFKLNRIKTSAYSNTSKFEQYYSNPTRFAIDVTNIQELSEDQYEITAKVEAAETLDNSSDRYRIGYVMTSTFFDPTSKYYYQANSAALSLDRFYYLPSTISAELMVFHDVTLGVEGAFNGVEYSLPEQIKADMNHSFTWTVERPELLEDMKAGRIVAIVLDTQTGIIENATAVNLNKEFGDSGIENIISEAKASTIGLRAGANGELTISANDSADYSLAIYGTDGSLCQQFKGIVNGTEVVKASLAKGIYVARLTANNETKTIKIAIR